MIIRALAVLAITLAALAVGWIVGHRRGYLEAEADCRREEARAARLAKLSFELACQRPMTLAEAEAAILRTMQTTRKPPRRSPRDVERKYGYQPVADGPPPTIAPPKPPAPR